MAVSKCCSLQKILQLITTIRKSLEYSKLNIDDHDPIVESILLIGHTAIDRSGSMASIYEDGNSKMDHINIPKNMPNYFNQFKNKASKSNFIMFDHEAEIVLRHAVVNDELIF